MQIQIRTKSELNKDKITHPTMDPSYELMGAVLPGIGKGSILLGGDTLLDCSGRQLQAHGAVYKNYAGSCCSAGLTRYDGTVYMSGCGGNLCCDNQASAELKSAYVSHDFGVVSAVPCFVKCSACWERYA